jgi:hypothetical protein
LFFVRFLGRFLEVENFEHLEKRGGLLLPARLSDGESEISVPEKLPASCFPLRASYFRLLTS